MSKEKFRRWVRRNNTTTNVLLIVVGVAIYFWGYLFFQDNHMYSGLVTAVGVNILTNSLLLILSLLYFQSDDISTSKVMYDEKGLINIYTEKNDTYSIINRDYLVNRRIKIYDIICCGGLTTLRKQEGDKIIEYVKNRHMKVRILTANPNCKSLLQFKIDEEIVLSEKKMYNVTPLDNTFKRDIYALYDWVNTANSDISENDKIEIRFYNALPSLQYHRVDSNLFISSRIIGAVSKASPTYEYVDTGRVNDCFNMYTDYFERLWNDPNFCTSSPEVNLNPRLLIEDNIINNMLKLACIDLAKYINNCHTNSIRASFTIKGYPGPLSDGLERRYNTNIARGNEIIAISGSNGKIVNGKKIGYVACDDNHVVGRTMKDGKRHFDPIDSDDDCAILSIPITNGQNEILATVNFDFRKELKTSLYSLDNKDLSEQNIDLVIRAEWWASLIATYLGVKESA